MSVLAAVILLAYGLGRFIEFPGRSLEFQFLGIYLPVELNTYTIVSFFVAALTAAGAAWMMSDHPQITQKSPIEHWILPALTAWVIGLPLFQLPLGLLWWGGFVVGGILLTLILIAEYIAIDPDDVRQPAAAVGLTALSFSLFLMLSMALRFSGARLILLLPTLTIAAWLVSLRTLHLRLGGRWAFVLAGLIALICAQIAAALHYMPLSPVTFGLVLLAPTYAVTSLIANFAEGESLRRAIYEPLLVFAILLAAALWIR
jgi:Protein of unknown function (DUF5656)